MTAYAHLDVLYRQPTYADVLVLMEYPGIPSHAEFLVLRVDDRTTRLIFTWEGETVAGAATVTEERAA